ncbi:MAG: ABC transporter permease, partial [Rubrivivax sp.]
MSQAPSHPPRPTGLWAIRQAIPSSVYWTLASVGLILPLLLWAVLAGTGTLDPVFLPGPGVVLARAQAWWADGLLGDMGISVMRVVVGWALSALIAIPLGLFIGTWRSVQALLEPLMDFVRYMPAVAFVPLVMVWVGIDEGAKIAIIFIGT